MKKQLFTLGLLNLFAVNLMGSSFDEHTLFDSNNEKAQWEFLEKAFITNIHAEKQLIWNHISAAFVASLGLGSGYQLYNGTTSNSQLAKTDLFSPTSLYSAVLGSSVALLSIKGLACHLSNQANRNAVEAFFTNWDQNQFYTPEALQEAFDIIAETIELQGLDAVLASADDIVDTIQFVVMRHFDGRYKKALEFQAFNALNDSKTFSEIIKNTVATAKDLAA